jgi:hypothetical protein
MSVTQESMMGEQRVPRESHALQAAQERLEQELRRLLATPFSQVDSELGRASSPRDRRQWVFGKILRWAEQQPQGQLDTKLSAAQLQRIDAWSADLHAEPAMPAPDRGELQTLLKPTNALLRDIVEQLKALHHGLAHDPTRIADAVRAGAADLTDATRELRRELQRVETGRLVVVMNDMTQKLLDKLEALDITHVGAQLSETVVPLRTAANAMANAASEVAKTAARLPELISVHEGGGHSGAADTEQQGRAGKSTGLGRK